jgi:splicing factor 3B subunit 1
MSVAEPRRTAYSQQSRRIADREDEYRARRRNRIISPERHDPFAGGETPDIRGTTYADIMRQQQLEIETQQVCVYRTP